MTPARSFDSPILMFLLRLLVFVGVTEAIFLRLIPPPRATPGAGLVEQLRGSLASIGGFTFFLAFFLVAIALINVAYRTLRHRFWPAGLNGFLAVSLLCLAALGVSAFMMEHGPLFAIGYTILALVTILFVAMNAFSSPGTGSTRALAVCYGGAVVCSAVGTIARFAGGIVWLGPPKEFLAERSIAAGELLLAAAGVLSFMSLFRFDPPARRGGVTGLAVLLGGLAAIGFAVGSLLAPRRVALLGTDVSGWRVLVLSTALFLATMTATACLLDPSRRLQGYGLLLLVLSGFPLRIVYQHMIAALGSVLIFAPAPIETMAHGRAGTEPLPQAPPIEPAVPSDAAEATRTEP